LSFFRKHSGWYDLYRGHARALTYFRRFLSLYRLTLPFVVGFLNIRLNMKRKLKKQAIVLSTNFNVYPCLSNEHSKLFRVIYQPKKGAHINAVSKRISKVGNDRLTARVGIKEYKENPFFISAKSPEYVSFITNSRLLIRAIIRGNIKEMKRLMSVERRHVDLNACTTSFSYADSRSADSVAIQCRNDVVRQEYFRLKSELNKAKTPRKEPNLLERKSTGQSNFYMIGRATRAIEMTRGGREGNNAFLRYGSASNDRFNGLVSLVESVFSLISLKLFIIDINMHAMDGMVVVAARLGLRELASAIAEGPARCNMNDLHRLTLTDASLPQRILPISVLKKGYDNANITPLHTAAINPNVKILERLRTIQPNMNIPDSNNWYTIHYAAVCEGAEPLKFLLRNGITPSVFNKQHESPLHVAARAGRKETIKVGFEERKSSYAFRLDAVIALLSHKSVLVDYPTSTQRYKLTPLMIACGLGDLPIAEYLVEHGAMIQAKDSKKRTALCHSVLNGQEHCAAMLLARGADLLKGDSSGNTPAHYASAYGWLECLQLLASIEPGCLKQENDWKLTPLSVAYLKGHYGIVRWLLEEKSDLVDINGKDMEGVTLLSSLLRYADEQSHSELVEQIQYLLSRLSSLRGQGIGTGLVREKITLCSPIDNAPARPSQGSKENCSITILRHSG
uniref:ANK_REP_REGION domain-containing protein n=1 Tax=Angiostrongylus cantonensis TaxID=6313 RepID=A0A158P5X7_ANGCA